MPPASILSFRALCVDSPGARIPIIAGRYALLAVCFAEGVAAAATDCDLAGIPKGAKALWGVNADAALDAYRAWQNRKAKR